MTGRRPSLQTRALCWLLPARPPRPGRGPGPTSARRSRPHAARRRLPTPPPGTLPEGLRPALPQGCQTATVGGWRGCRPRGRIVHGHERASTPRLPPGGPGSARPTGAGPRWERGGVRGRRQHAGTSRERRTRLAMVHRPAPTARSSKDWSRPGPTAGGIHADARQPPPHTASTACVSDGGCAPQPPPSPAPTAGASCGGGGPQPQPCRAQKGEVSGGGFRQPLSRHAWTGGASGGGGLRQPPRPEPCGDGGLQPLFRQAPKAGASGGGYAAHPPPHPVPTAGASDSRPRRPPPAVALSGAPPPARLPGAGPSSLPQTHPPAATVCRPTAGERLEMARPPFWPPGRAHEPPHRPRWPPPPPA